MRLLVLLMLGCQAMASTARAGEQPEVAVERDRDEERELGWANSANLGFVVTSGNSSTSTLSIDDTLSRTWENAALTFSGGALRVGAAGDRFAVGTADDFVVIEDSTRELDQERYYFFGRYDRDITERLFWVVGGGWDRDANAGIDSRAMVWGGLGTTWRDDDRIRFKTDYGITFTRRVDVIPDPGRDESYSEARVSSSYEHELAAETRFHSDFVFFMNLADGGDYRFNTLNAVTTNLSSVFALRFGLQFLYQGQPAFERIGLRPVEAAPSAGTVLIRKKNLDSVLTFSVVMTF